MKLFMNILVSIFIAVTASAQQTSSMASPGKSQSGFSVGLNYFNFSDFDVKVDRGTVTETERAKDIGFGGIDIGYNKTPNTGFGYAVKLLFLSRSESDENVNFIAPQFNLNLAFSSSFLAYAGVNVSEMTQPTTELSKKHELGGQAGIGIRFNRNVSLNLGYLLLRQRYEADFGSYGTFSMTPSYGGFHSSLGYTF